MTKQELASHIASRTGIETAAVKLVLDEAAETIMNTLAKGENYYQRGFGTFFVRMSKEKVGRDICAGKQVIIPARPRPKFKPCKEFRATVAHE